MIIFPDMDVLQLFTYINININLHNPKFMNRGTEHNHNPCYFVYINKIQPLLYNVYIQPGLCTILYHFFLQFSKRERKKAGFTGLSSSWVS